MRDLKQVLVDINTLPQADRDVVINCSIEAYINNHTNKDLMALACCFVKTMVERVNQVDQIDPICTDIANLTKMYFKDPQNIERIFE